MKAVRDVGAGLYVGYCVWIWVLLTPLISASDHDLNFAAAGGLLVVTALAIAAGIAATKWLKRADGGAGVRLGLVALAVGAVPAIAQTDGPGPGIVLWAGGGALVVLLSLFLRRRDPQER